jgi:ABC-type phosphate/phosphonate transport system substrate-binding protein
MSRRKVAIVLAALAAVLMLGTCGGSSDDEQTSTTEGLCAVAADYGAMSFASAEEARSGLLAVLTDLEAVLPTDAPADLEEAISAAIDELEAAPTSPSQSVTEFIDSLGTNSGLLVFANAFYPYVEVECGSAPEPAGFDYDQF